jgi:hypothetical protein
MYYYPSTSCFFCTIFNTRYAQGTKNSKLCALRVFVFNLVGGYAALGFLWPMNFLFAFTGQGAVRQKRNKTLFFYFPE